MLTIRLELNPVPASRPRVTRWGTYYGKNHQAFRSEALALLSQMREDGILPEVPMSGKLRVWVVFSLKKPKTTKLKTPRGDIDNYMKLLLDCCNGIIWEDDQQIAHINAFKDFASDEGSIDLVVEEIDDETDGPVHPARRDEPIAPDPESPEDQGLDNCARGYVFIPNFSTCSPC